MYKVGSTRNVQLSCKFERWRLLFRFETADLRTLDPTCSDQQMPSIRLTSELEIQDGN